MYVRTVQYIQYIHAGTYRYQHNCMRAHTHTQTHTCICIWKFNHAVNTRLRTPNTMPWLNDLKRGSVKSWKRSERASSLRPYLRWCCNWFQKGALVASILSCVPENSATKPCLCSVLLGRGQNVAMMLPPWAQVPRLLPHDPTRNAVCFLIACD